MKKRIIQGVRRITAMTLAFVLAWSLFAGSIPGTIVNVYADDANTFRYSRDTGVASVTITNSAGVPVIFEQDADGTFYKDGFTNTDYPCQIPLRDGFTLVDNTNINYDMLTVSQEMLDNDASQVDFAIQTKLSADLVFTNIEADKVKEISSVTVGGASLSSIPDDTDGTKYTIPADTLASTPVVVTLTTSPAYYGSQDAGYEYMELEVDAVGNQSRKYTYTTTVGDLKNAGGVIDIDGSLKDTEQLLVVNGEVTSNARVTINPSDYGYDDTTGYKPMYEGETCTVVIEPDNGYKVVAEPEESVVRDPTSLAITYEISNETTELPTVEIKLIEPDANVEIAGYWSESEFVISQYLLDNPGNAPNRSLYFSLGKNENELCDWSVPVSDFHSGSNGPVDIKLPLPAPSLPDASGEYYIYAKFMCGTDSSDVVGVRGIGEQPIYIDVTPPEVGYDESYIKIGNNQYGEFASKDKEGTNGTFWINKADIDAGAALSIPVSDNYSKEITYTVEADPTCDGFPKTGSQTSGEAYNGSLEILLNPVMNGTRLDYYFQDVIGSKENNGVVEKFGNEATGSLDLSNIKYDTQVPTLGNVSFQNEDGTIADTDLVNWQPKAVTMTLAGVENTAGNGTGESVSDLQGVYVSINGVKQSMTKDGETYSYSFDNTGDYVVEIYARDKAGNESEHKEYRIKIDKDGMSNAKITFDPVCDMYSSAFQVKASVDSFCGVEQVEFSFENAEGEVLFPEIASDVVENNTVTISASIEALHGKREVYVRAVITDKMGCEEEVRTVNPIVVTDCVDANKDHKCDYGCNKVTEHTWDAGVITKEPTPQDKGEKTYTCTFCKATKTEEVAALGVPEVGTEDVSDDGKATYKVTKSDLEKGTVTYVAPTDAKATTVTIPATVEIDGVKYNVTAIEKNAFKKNKNLKKVTIGKNVKTIGANAFYNCTKLKTVKFGSNVTTIGDKAFYKCTALTKISLPSKVKTIGKSAFEGCKKVTSVTIGKSVAKIGEKAFYGCSKVKTITIKTTKLTTKKIGSKAFAKTPKSMTVKVPKKKFTAYKSMLIKKGVNKKAKFKKN